jgi:betaine-aldehyde dehydrogenase
MTNFIKQTDVRETLRPKEMARSGADFARSVLPRNRVLYYDGGWHIAKSGREIPVESPGTGESLGSVADGDTADIDTVVASARRGFELWRNVHPLERAAILREIALLIRRNARELAAIDAIDCGNPFTPMISDTAIASSQLDFFAGLVTEMKGHSIPMGPDAINFSVREPLGVVAKISPFNHPLMFSAGKIAAPLAAGNSVVVKPPEQAPLSTLRLAELIDGLLPPGVFNVATGGRETGKALAVHPDVAMLSLVGSVATGRSIMSAAAHGIRPVLLELGGKNALIALADADPSTVADAMIAGMNFAWCGQSCGSTSRAFIHTSIYGVVLKHLRQACESIRPGIPTEPETTMGAIISRPQFDRILAIIEMGRKEGARLLIGGSRSSNPALMNGLFIDPTVFVDVTTDMTIAREEIFGPVLSVLRWESEADMIHAVNELDYGLTCSIWTNDFAAAHRMASLVEAGYVWVNEVGRHFLGAPFGGYKQSGIGREECLGELISYTQEKNVYIKLPPPEESRSRRWSDTGSKIRASGPVLSE